MRRHSNGLQRRRAVTIDGHARDVGEAGQNGGHSCDIETTLTGGRAAAHDEVFNQCRVETRDTGENPSDDARQ